MTFGCDILKPSRALSPFLNKYEANKYTSDWLTCYLADHPEVFLAPAERIMMLRSDNSACLGTRNGWVQQ